MFEFKSNKDGSYQLLMTTHQVLGEIFEGMPRIEDCHLTTLMGMGFRVKIFI